MSSVTAAVPIQEDAWGSFRVSEPWRRLTPQQKVWVAAFISNGGDPIASTRMAYHCKSAKNGRCLSYEVREHPAVVAALNFWAGKSEREILIEQVRFHLERAEPGSIAAQKLTDQLERLVLSGQAERSGVAGPEDVAENPSVQTFPIGAVLRQDGKSYRVVAEEIS